jgi:hypothetical protein
MTLPPRWIALTLFLLALPAIPQPPHSQPPNQPDQLTEATLTAAGLHLPSNTTLDDLSKLTASEPTHMQAVIYWDVLPGAPNRVLHNEIKNWTRPSTLTVIHIVRDVPKSAGKIPRDMPDALWIVGLSAAKEVRSIGRTDDARWFHADDGTEDSFETKQMLRVDLRNDSTITSFVLCESGYEDEKWLLRKIGEVEIPASAN